jgi:hypothetical protein
MKVENPTLTIFEFRGKTKRCILIEGNYSPENFIQYFRQNGYELSPTDFTGEWYIRKGDNFPANVTVEMWINKDNIDKLFHERNAKQLYEITRFKKLAPRV